MSIFKIEQTNRGYFQCQYPNNHKGPVCKTVEECQNKAIEWGKSTFNIHVYFVTKWLGHWYLNAK